MLSESAGLGTASIRTVVARRTQHSFTHIVGVTAAGQSSSYFHSKGASATIFAMAKGKTEDAQKSDVLQGTPDLMVLKTLRALGPLHGFGIARRIEQLSEQ